MTLHELLQAGSLDAAATALLEARRPDLAKYPELLKVLDNPAARADAMETGSAIATYLLMSGDHAGARVAYAAGLGAAAASKVLHSCRLVADPAACYALESLPAQVQARYAREVMTLGGGSPLRLPPPQVARLENGVVYGLTFLPVTAGGEACASGFVHNPNTPEKLLRLEDVETLPIGSAGALLGCFDGVDEFDEAILIGSSGNFGHWLFNHLARLAFAAAIPGHDRLPVVVGENSGATHLECLARLGCPPSRLIRLRKGRLARFRRLWAPMMPFCVGMDNRLYWSPRMLEFLRRGLGVAAESTPRRGKRLLIARPGAKWRRLLNEDVLRKMLSEQGFQAVDPGALSLGEQVAIAADAEAIVGVFGAGMNLALFAPPGAKVVELGYQKANPGEMNILPAICERLGQPFRAVRGVPLVQKDVNPLNYDFLVPAGLLREALASLEVAP